MKELIALASKLPVPSDYFSGLGGDPWCWPRNLIAFLRTTRHDLQRRTFENRLHTRYVLVNNLGTAGTLNLDSTHYRLLPGECHLIFPHQLHTYHDLERDHLRWLFITFELPDETPLHPLRQTTVRLDAGMTNLLKQFLMGHRNKRPSAHHLQALLSGFLLRMVERANQSASRPAKSPQIDADFLDTIRRHHARTLPDPLTIAQLARHMHLSESRLRARFRTAFGLSLGAYLRNLRLQEAVAMLRHSRASITDIALSCGFSSSATFSRAFRAWSQTTPRAFRQTHPGKSK